MSAGAALSMGFVLGLRHATDADHIAAVATLLRREQGLGGAARIGGLWGVGHASVLVCAGAVLAALGWRVPPRAATVAELGVCAMLIVLGVVGLVRAWRDESPGPVRGTGLAARDAAGVLVVGAVHGLAGSAGAVLLAASAVGPSRTVPFLLVFGLGTIAGMSATTMAMSAALRGASSQSSRAHRALRLGASAASVGLGVVLGGWLLRGS
jgi:nickel/cobalt exporter